MKLYKAHLKQAGEGCGYTIDCGCAVIEIQALDLKDAVEKLKNVIKENYSHDESRLETCNLYEVSDAYTIDLNDLYYQIDNEEVIAEAKAIEEREKQEFERLKAKYGNA